MQPRYVPEDFQVIDRICLALQRAGISRSILLLVMLEPDLVAVLGLMLGLELADREPSLAKEILATARVGAKVIPGGAGDDAHTVPFIEALKGEPDASLN